MLYDSFPKRSLFSEKNSSYQSIRLKKYHKYHAGMHYAIKLYKE